MEERTNCVQFSRPRTGEIAWRGGLATYIVQSWQGEENKTTLFFLRDRVGSRGITHSGDPLHTFHRSNKICIQARGYQQLVGNCCPVVAVKGSTLNRRELKTKVWKLQWPGFMCDQFVNPVAAASFLGAVS